MDEAPYTKREEDKFREGVVNDLNEIKVQTKLTNGSVAKLKLWQARMLGAIAVIVFFIAAVIMPIIIVIIQIKLAGK